MAGKRLDFINRYWGDIAWFLTLPLHIYFYYLVINNEVDIDAYLLGTGEKTPPVDQRLSMALFCIYLAFSIVGACRIMFRKKYLLRDFHYLIIGALATYCFAGFIVPWLAACPYLSQSHFLNGVKVLQGINSTFLTSRIAIWLYKWWQEPKHTEKTPVAAAQQTD